MRRAFFVFGAVVGLFGICRGSDGAQLPLAASADDFVCRHPPYKIHMVATSPLVMHIGDFLTVEEREHLIRVSNNTFSHSKVAGKQGGASSSAQRTSQSTYVARDPVVRCIEQRALTFQGYDVPASHLEPLQLVRYAPGEQYRFHTDWFTEPANAAASAGGNRVSSFFAYVHVAEGTTGGGTNFPLLDAPRSSRWCDERIVDCDEPWEKGVTFRPVAGSAIFWVNLLPGGRGDYRVLHAGLPVETGDKIGMNIWTRQAPLGMEMREAEYPE